MYEVLGLRAAGGVFDRAPWRHQPRYLAEERAERGLPPGHPDDPSGGSRRRRRQAGLMSSAVRARGNGRTSRRTSALSSHIMASPMACFAFCIRESGRILFKASIWACSGEGTRDWGCTASDGLAVLLLV